MTSRYNLSNHTILVNINTDLLRVGVSATLLAHGANVLSPAPCPMSPVDLTIVDTPDKYPLNTTSSTHGSVIFLGDGHNLPVIDTHKINGAVGWLPTDYAEPILLSTVQLVLAGFDVIPRCCVDKVDQTYIHSKLTPRQIDILRRLRRGHSNKRIALDLNISVGTVKQHLNVIFAVLQVKNRVQAALLLIPDS